MNGIRKKKILSEVNPDPERQTWYVLTHKWVLDIKQRITSLQSMTSEKLSNIKTLKETYMDPPGKGK